MDMNEELIRKLKAAHWRITRLMVDNGAGMRPIIDGALVVVAKASPGAQVKNLGLQTLSPMDPQGCILKLRFRQATTWQLKKSVLAKRVHIHSRGPYSSNRRYALWMRCIVRHHWRGSVEEVLIGSQYCR